MMGVQKEGVSTQLFCLALEGSTRAIGDIYSVKHALLAVSNNHEDGWCEGELDSLAQCELLSTIKTAAMALEQVAAELRYNVSNPLQNILNSATKKEPEDLKLAPKGGA